jgi:hypothetical protein
MWYLQSHFVCSNRGRAYGDLALGTDVARLWNHPESSVATRKRILRTVLEEIVVIVEPGVLRPKLHWKRGDHTMLEVVKNRCGQHRWKTSAHH